MSRRAEQPVLLVEDTRSLSLVYEKVLRNEGLAVECAYLAAEARALHKGASGRLVLLDLMLPDGDGLDLLTEMREIDPAGKVIVITSNGSINRAVSAMRGGAFDFLVKPFDGRRLLSAVGNALDEIAKAGKTRRATPKTGNGGFHDFIGDSPGMLDVYRLIGEIGRSTATVFITGESGAGKEVAAQAIHAESGRSAGPFIALNCGAIPRDLLESEVFGHLKGSFTGAIVDKPGAAVAADKGTLFLDEVCELDLALQTKLLRFLQTSTVTPVGATSPRKVDARIICATNRNPAEEVRAGRFREDLFYRLHVVPIHLPPLRERGEDVIEAAETFLLRFAAKEGKRFTRLSPALADVFRKLPWPGNMRQLQNVMWNIALLHDGEEAVVAMLPPGLIEGVNAPTGPKPEASGGAAHGDGRLAREAGLAARIETLVGATMAEIEREFIEATIAAHDGSVPKAARVLDLSPSTIYRKRESWSKDAG